MSQYQFIFSDEPGTRLKRHLLFWGCWWIFFGFLYAAIPLPLGTAYWQRLPATMLDALFFMVAHIFLAYLLMYVVLPVFLLRNRYLLTALSVILCFILTACISSFLAIYMINPIKAALLPRGLYELLKPRAFSFSYGLLAGLRGGITVAGIAMAIKLMKHWYIKEQRNLQLQKENIASQLQLLKAQVHPHFLFNTLNNIYAHTQDTSPVASRLVMGLSEMLRYMLYEANQSLVPLSKELKMVEDYITLEKIRYGNQLEVHLDLPRKTNDLLIAPLLLVPFVENCFKHGASHMIDCPWLSLRVTVEGNTFGMKLMNGKPAAAFSFDNTHGIGITNVKKRLELLYAGKHELYITNEPEVYIVSLKLQLTGIAKTSLSTEPVNALSHA